MDRHIFHVTGYPVAVRITRGWLFPVLPPMVIETCWEESVEEPEHFTARVAAEICCRFRLEARHALN
jgi:hypothetical protein